jgi:hypothetical protein
MNFVFTVSGFTQQRYARYGSGSLEVWRKIHVNHASPGRTQVLLLEWHEDPKGYAKMVAFQSKKDDKIMVCAYSYGGGWWFRRFSEELNKLGRDVDVAVLCDPVYRRPWYLRWMQWRAMGKQTLKLGPNIKRVVHFTQYVDEPGGDAIELAPETDYEGPIDLALPHVKMDNSIDYLNTCVDEARELFTS